MDPGTEWGAGATSTADNTLRRNATVCTGDANGADVFVPTTQWIGYPIDMVTAFDLDDGADNVIGSRDDLRGDDLSLLWFRNAGGPSELNNPFTVAAIVDETTNQHWPAPPGHSFAEVANRNVAALRGVPGSEAVMVQGAFPGKSQRSLGHDDVATLRFGMSGRDRTAGTSDDDIVRLVYRADNNAGNVCALALGADVVGGGGTANATFAVQVASPLRAGVDQLTNNASVMAANAITPVNANDTTLITAAPDLAVDKDDGGAIAQAATVLTYTLTVDNNGNQNATGAVITENRPGQCHLQRSSHDCSVGLSARRQRRLDLHPRCRRARCWRKCGGRLRGADRRRPAAGDGHHQHRVGRRRHDQRPGSVHGPTTATPSSPRPTRPRPRSSGSTTSPASPAGEVTECEELRINVSAIAVEFDEVMAQPAVTTAANYRVIGAGPDAALATTSCAALAGDDVSMTDLGRELGRANSDRDARPPGHRAAVGLLSTARLPDADRRGRDAAGNPLDGNGNATGGDAFSRTFRVELEKSLPQRPPRLQPR